MNQEFTPIILIHLSAAIAALVLGIADGWLSADGTVIYRASDLKVGLFKQDAPLTSGAA